MPFALNRDNVNLIDLLFATWNNAFKPYWKELSLGASWVVFWPLLMQGVELLLSNMGVSVPYGFSIAVGMAQYIFMCGFFEMTHMAWKGQKPIFNILSNTGAGLQAYFAAIVGILPLILFFLIFAIGAVVGIEILDNPLVLIALLAPICIALLVWLLPLAFLFQPFAENPKIGVMAAIRLCFERCTGVRLKVFAMVLVSAGIGVLGLFACGIGIIPATALAFAFQTGLWKALSTPGVER
jgi:hypothetical protein